jgi:hypothetical protein
LSWVSEFTSVTRFLPKRMIQPLILRNSHWSLQWSYLPRIKFDNWRDSTINSKLHGEGQWRFKQVLGFRPSNFRNSI